VRVIEGVMRRISIIIITTILFFNCKGQDSTNNAYSLKEAQTYAIKNNYQVQMASIEIGISQKTVSSLIALGMPQVEGSGSFQHFIDIPTSVVPADAFGFPNWFNQWINDVSQSTTIYPNAPATQEGGFQELQFGSRYSSTAGINIRQLIFDGSYLVGLKGAKTFVQVNEQILVKTEIEIKALVAKAYYTVLVSHENVKITNTNVKNLRKTLKETEVLWINGFMEENDISQIKLMVANAESALINAKQQEKISRNILKFQMGLDISTKITPTDKLENLIIESLENAIKDEFSPEAHIDFQLARTQVTLMSLKQKAEKSKFLPTVDGFFNHQQNSFRNEFSFFDGGKWYPSTLWGLNISVPLFGGFGQKAVIQRASLELEKAEIQQSQVNQSLKLQMQTALMEYTAAIEHYENQKQNLDLAENIRDLTEIKFQQGVASSTDLTMAENQYSSTQSNYIQAMFRLLNAKSNLDKTAGQLL